MAKSGVVEINGKRYDATTGKLLGAVQRAAAVITPNQGQVMDGFVRRPAKTKPARAQNVHQKTQRSVTIMRSVVAKPKLKAAAPIITKPATKARSAIVSSTRLFRAKTVLRSPKISRFHAALPAKEGEIIDKQPPAMASAMPTRALSRPVSSSMAHLSHNQLERLLDEALTRADAHKKALKNHATGPLRAFKRVPRWLGVSLLLTLVIGLGGFFVWRNVPEVSLKIAAARAHVDATVPSYIPVGYSLETPVSYSSGTVQMELKSATDPDKSVTITQQNSSLDSEALKESTVPTNAPVQTTDVNGAPLYIYGKDDNAVFKKGDTKVLIENKAHLSPSELSNIAKSL